MDATDRLHFKTLGEAQRLATGINQSWAGYIAAPAWSEVRGGFVVEVDMPPPRRELEATGDA